jgi:sugar lactone lactonase YvrE
VVVGSGFSAPRSVAVDRNGNVFVVDTGHNAVKEVLAPDYTMTAQVAVLNGNFNTPLAIAIDAAGNLFVADSGTAGSPVKEITAASGYVTVATVAGGFGFLTGVAVDKLDNLFVADSDTNIATEVLAASGYTTRKSIGDRFAALSGIAVDGSGNVFVADQINGVQEITAESGYITVNNLASGNPNIVQPFGIWVDSDGNVFFTDLTLGQVAEIFASGGYSNLLPVLGSLDEPTGVATDNNGDLFVADPNNGTGGIDELQAPGSVFNFGAIAIAASTPPTSTLTFTFDAGGTIQAPQVLTQGTAGLDFSAAGGSCHAGNYNPGESCTVIVSFSPMQSGEREGAVELRNSSGTPFITVYVYGTGSGPQIAFSPGTQSTLGSGFSAPQGVAADGAGNVFVADTGNNAVKEILASGGSTAVRTLGSGFSAPQGVAVDGAGNVFIADTGSDAVKELTAADGYSLVNTVGSGFSGPTGVSVDGGGNVYVADTGNHVVKEILAAGGYATVNTLPANTTPPSNTEANVNGNLYIADTANDRVLKQDQTTPPSLSFAATAVGSTSSDSPQTVTITNEGNATLTFPIPATGNNAGISNSFTLGYGSCPELTSSASSPFTLAAGTSCTYLVSYSPATNGVHSGSLTVTDNNLNAALPVGTTQSLVLNGGPAQSTQTISFSQPASPVTYGVSPITLTASATSSLTVAFSVLSGPGTINGSVLTVTGAGTIVIAANQAGNASYAPAAEVQQSITVNPATPTITWATPSPITYGTALSAIQLDAVLSVAGSCTYLPAAGTVLSAGAQTLTATCTPTDTTDYSSVSKTVSLTVNQATPTIAWTAPSAITYGTALSATQLNAALSVAGGCTYLPAAGTVLSAGVQTLTATCTPTDTTDYKTPMPSSMTLTVNRAPLTVTASSASIAYGAAVPVITPSYSGLVNGDTSSVLTTAPSCATMYTTTSADGVYPTTCSGAVAANYNISYIAGAVTVGLAPQTITFTKPTTPVIYGASAATLSASASSGLAVTFSASGACAVTGSSLIYTSAGTCTVTASQAGNTDYAAATAVSYTVTVNQAMPTITWPTPAAITYGTALSAIELNATASVAGSITYTATPTGGGATAVSSGSIQSGSILTAGTYALTATFTPSDTTDFASAIDTVSLTVSPATAVIGSLSPAYVSAGGTAFTLTVTGTNFTSGATVYWGSTALTTTYVSATQLTAAVTATQVASEGIATVSVLASDGSFSNTLAFAIDTASATAPTFTSATVTVTPGTAATYPVTLPTTTSGVAVTCLNLPAGASCSYSSTANAVTITTSSATPAGSYQVTIVFTEQVTSKTTAGILLPILLLPLLWMRRKLMKQGAWLTACLAVVLLAGTIFSVGCGGTSNSTSITTTQTTSSGVVTLIVN